MKFKLNPITGKMDVVASASMDDNLMFSCSEPTQEKHGGIASGETFDNVPITDVLKRILYPHVAPVVSLNANVAGGVYEKGKTLQVELKVSVQRKSSDICKVEFFNGSNLLHSVAEVHPGSATYSFYVDISYNMSITAKVTDTNDTSSTSNVVNYTFNRPIYYGLTPNIPTSIDDFVKVIPSSLNSSTTLSYGSKFGAFSEKRMVFAVIGSMSTMYDMNGFDITASFEKTTAIVKCLDDKEMTYTLYYSNLCAQEKTWWTKATYSAKN